MKVRPNTIKVTKDAIITYCKSNSYKATEKQIQNQKNLSNTSRKGIISRKAKSRLTGYVCNYSDAIQKIEKSKIEKSVREKIKLTFATLTLPATQKHDDKSIKRLILNEFLIVLKKKGYAWAYLWRAEKQKNGNIHFHILLPSYIHFSELNRLWNQSLEILGYVSMYQEKMRKLTLSEYIRMRRKTGVAKIKEAVKAYKKGKSEDWKNPNSTDIKRVENKKSASRYICKYVTKQEKNQKNVVTGALWGCSDNIKEMQSCNLELTQQIIQGLEAIKSKKRYREIERDYVTISFIPSSIIKKEIYSVWELYNLNITNNILTLVNYSNDIPPPLSLALSSI